MLEDVVAEFDIQGLELDCALFAWDADFRFLNGEWTYNNFSSIKWQKMHKADKILYFKSAYRILLAHARQGMIVFIPDSSDTDHIRGHEFYDGTYNYLKEEGITEL